MRRAVWASAAFTVLILALVLAACGGGDGGGEGVASLSGSAQAASAGDGGGTTTGSEQDREEALLAFARCMREHGVDVPDPEPGGGPIRVGPGSPGGDFDPERFREAQEACGDLLADVRPPELSEADRQALEDAFLEFARCMREHGIDIPDPQFDGEGGGFVTRLGGSIDPDDPDFREAQEACQPLLEDARRGIEQARP